MSTGTDARIRVAEDGDERAIVEILVEGLGAKLFPAFGRAAARAVDLTPAALGQRIKQLEDLLDVKLFHRTNPQPSSPRMVVAIRSARSVPRLALFERPCRRPNAEVWHELRPLMTCDRTVLAHQLSTDSDYLFPLPEENKQKPDRILVG